MTDRLYYTDPYLQAFDATVERVDRRGERLVVTLNRTAFYPSSGGQPFDTGALGPLRVVDVVDDDDGSIAHVVEPGTAVEHTGGPRVVDVAAPADQARSGVALEPGQAVHGAIDWARRFDHMQQHTGQHVLSAAFERLFRIRTVSFHLGAAVSTIDLAREATAAEIAAAEAEANRVVWEDRPVAIRFVTAEEAARLPLRKEPVRGGTLRLIDVDAFDLSACGGTHVARTGAIGVIAVAAWERFKGGQRIGFVCGGRALGAFRALRDTVTASVRLLSVLPDELPSAIERLQAEAKDHKRAMTALQGELARYRAEELAASADTVPLHDVRPSTGKSDGATARLKPDTTDGSVGDTPAATPDDRHVRLVARAVDADASGLKTLAAAIVVRPGYLVVLVSVSTPALVVVARSSDVALSAQQVLATLIASFGGRGGGRPELAQGGGLVASPDAILDAARAII
jgi:alanyl-tRNA synthetase